MTNFHESGNLTRDPEMRFTPSGTSKCTFSIAVNREITRGGATEKEVDFFDVVCWRNLADNVAMCLHKGDHVTVRGTIKQHRWTNDAGESRSRLEVTASDVGASLRFAHVDVHKITREEAPDARVPASVGAPSQGDDEQYGEEPF